MHLFSEWMRKLIVLVECLHAIHVMILDDIILAVVYSFLNETYVLIILLSFALYMFIWCQNCLICY